MPAQPNQSLIEGMHVLQMLVAEGQPVGSREMAQRLGLEPTRVNRLLGTLAFIGLAEQTPERKYRPGPGIHVLAAQSLQGSNLLAAALPHLERLRGAPSLTVALGVRWQTQVCFLFHARPGMRLDEAIGTHRLESAGHSSIGVLLLARDHNNAAVVAAAEEEMRGVATAPREPLAASVVHAKEHGFARLVYPSGDVSLAVAVGEPPVAGIALAGRFDAAREPGLIEQLRHAATLIAVDLRAPVKRT